MKRSHTRVFLVTENDSLENKILECKKLADSQSVIRLLAKLDSGLMCMDATSSTTTTTTTTPKPVGGGMSNKRRRNVELIKTRTPKAMDDAQSMVICLLQIVIGKFIISLLKAKLDMNLI